MKAKIYNEEIEAARTAMLGSEVAKTLLDPSLDPQVILRFLIEFSSRGVQITEPVDAWITRAGRRCVELGLRKTGEQLIRHAKHEAGHHLMLIEDTKNLVRRYESTGLGTLDAEALLARRPTPQMAAYIQLHEETIRSDAPYGQVAIEREIEGLSVSLGAGFIAQCERALGREGLKEISFLTEHVEIDVGHTAFNENLIHTLLEAHPEALEPLVRAGTAALEIYMSFLGECLTDAFTRRRSASGVDPATRRAITA